MVFADVVRSTALAERVDPETLRWAMQRWFGRMRDAVERNGGTVEKFIGDAVVAVFGVPVAHEDDVLRAVRAAAEMREQMAALGGELRRERGVEFAVRIGVNTGEAVTGAAAAGGSFTTGDTVNVAARLEQSARPGDILLGRDTYRLVRHAVDAEPVAPLTVKGKGTALEAFRLLSVVPAARGRPDACARRWWAGSASCGRCWMPLTEPSPTARAGCSPCLAWPGWASRASSPRSSMRCVVAGRLPSADAFPTVMA
jgi:class 3 adenylate cyclase